MIRPAILALMLLASPAYADTIPGLDEAPDDVECWVEIDTYRVTYTYRSSHMPKIMPVEGMMCRLRDYEAEAKFFTGASDHFYEYWKKLPQEPTGN